MTGEPVAPAPVTAAAAATTGSIYDLGYRGYEGPRLGRRHAIRALFMQTLRSCYGIGRGGRAKLAPFILLGLATVPAVVMVGAFALIQQVDPAEFPDGASPIRHDNYYGVIATLLGLFCAAQAPEALGRDQRHNLLALYFSRALRRTDYALARFAGIAVAVLLFALLPQAVIFFGLVLSASDVGAELTDELAFVPAIVGQAVLLAGVLGGLSAAVSAWTPRRAYATAAVIVILVVTPVVSTVLIELGTTTLATLLALISPPDVLDATGAWFFDRRPESVAVIFSDLPLEAFIVAALVMSAGCLALLVWRFRRVQA